MRPMIAATLAAATLLSACTNPTGFGPGSGAAGAPGAQGVAGGIVPGSASDPASAAYFQQTVGDRVLFAVDQSTLSGEARTALTRQARWLQQNPGFTAVIEGHADEQGTREYNLALGARRAAAAQEFLVSQGIASSRLRTVTYGKERPLEICSSEACYAQNRRAVTVLAGGVGSV
ncbi:peptidoglycan-associated lipoprotein [Hasllibacter halocynthiae]|uniref:Peptidoglycan-associated lipoprotein n=1 Tax=Hasllibacter halocynthiae TaxID=595589 RepID=A0A2T0X9L7_9RHOB|nr:peptidoglycan-associated lipoprotein Pal [Hasllibacter halocynthiae]PRY95638.1 peptidoglycan-associated lipoprotein [Hasllibacter halocynthiae]